MRYPSDLNDSEWNKISDFFRSGNYGNRSIHSKRELVNAVRYITKTGCQWRQLPKDFAPWSTVHSFFRRAKKRGMAEKKIKGRKRYIATDTQGHLLHVRVHAANIHDTSMGGKIFEETLKKYPSLQGVCFDAGYRGTTVEYVTSVLNKVANISSRITDKWAVLPVRWIVERTLSWFNGSRRLAKDFEISTLSEEAFIMIAHSSTILKRLG